MKTKATTLISTDSAPDVLAQHEAAQAPDPAPATKFHMDTTVDLPPDPDGRSTAQRIDELERAITTLRQREEMIGGEVRSKLRKMAAFVNNTRTRTLWVEISGLDSERLHLPERISILQGLIDQLKTRPDVVPES